MPGASLISGIMGCSNERCLSDDKPRSLTYDAEFVVGVENNQVRAGLAVLNHFRESTEPPFVNSAFYSVSGKLAEIDDDFFVGRGYKASTYDFLIDAKTVRIFVIFLGPKVTFFFPSFRWCYSLKWYRILPSDRLSASVVLFVHCLFLSTRFLIFFPFSLTKAGPKKSEREFLFDVRNYVAGSQRKAGHVCILPASNRRFAEKVPLPSEARFVLIGGFIAGRAVFAFGDEHVKRIPVEVDEITFLGADAASTSSSRIIGVRGGSLICLLSTCRFYRSATQSVVGRINRCDCAHLESSYFNDSLLRQREA
jgi:hypothetical protein